MSSQRHKTGAVIALGVALRLGLLLWAGELEPWADEGQYVYQALAWKHFGFYLGSPGWVWPPGYPGLLALCFWLFGEGGLLAAKLLQVALSGLVGASVAQLSGHLWNPRAARAAAWIWAGYLPLAAFSHYLWPETVFAALLVPAVYLFLTVVRPRGAVNAPLRLALVGGLLGLTLLFKEATLPLLGLLPLILLAAPAAGPLPRRLAGAAALVLAAAVVVAPWSLRTWQVYGRLVPSGATLGENLYQGVNAHYINFDYGGPERVELSTGSLAYQVLARPAAGVEVWPRSAAPNTVDQTAQSIARARVFARAHPGFFLRTRIKKLADWVSPLSFFVRHQRNGVYEGSLGSAWARVPLVLLAVGSTLLVLWFGLLGLVRAVPRGPARATFLAVGASFLAGALVVSMSRYRLQVEPFLIAAAAGWLTSREESSPGARLVGRVALGLLALLWAIDAQEVLDVLRRTL